MRKSVTTLMLATMLTGTLAAGPLYAHPASGGCRHGDHAMGVHGPGGGEHRFMHFADRLNLTQAQRTTIRAVFDKARPQMRTLRDRMRHDRRALHELMAAGKADPAQVRKLADAQGRNVAEMIVLRSGIHRRIQAVLTPEQRQHLQKMWGSHSHHWR